MQATATCMLHVNAQNVQQTPIKLPPHASQMQVGAVPASEAAVRLPPQVGAHQLVKRSL